MIKNLSAILLAGGKGTRMGEGPPKQFRILQDRPVALWSFNILKTICEEVVVVAEEKYRHLFEGALFADPGIRRQDSSENGFKKCTKQWILVHDSARPFLTSTMIESLMKEALSTGAASLAIPCEATLRLEIEGRHKLFPRDKAFFMQTPQLIRRDLMALGLLKAHSENIHVTDDISLIELLQQPITLVPGSKKNLKITTEEDLLLALFLSKESTCRAIN